MDMPKHTPSELRRSTKGLSIRAGALLFLLSAWALTVPGFAAAADPVAEVAAAAGPVTETVSAPAPAPTSNAAPASDAPAAAPAPTPSPAPTPTPSPAPRPASVTGTVTGAADRSLGSGSPTSNVVNAATHQVAETVDAAAATAGVTEVPLAGDSARSAGSAVHSLVGETAEGVAGKAAPHQPHPSGAAAPNADGRETGAAPRRGQVTSPPSSTPHAANGAFSWAVPQAKLNPSERADTTVATLASGLHQAPGLVASTSTPNGGNAGPAPTRSPDVPSSPAPLGAAVSSAPGTGSTAFFILLLGLLAVFALAAPKALSPLLTNAVGCRPAEFVCALERPG